MESDVYNSFIISSEKILYIYIYTYKNIYIYKQKDRGRNRERGIDKQKMNANNNVVTLIWGNLGEKYMGFFALFLQLFLKSKIISK